MQRRLSSLRRLSERYGATLLGLFLMTTYAFLFWCSLAGRWFNPNWTTDDAAQQQYLFHEVFSPGLFKGDPISAYFRTYVPPLHSAIMWHVTNLVGDTILSGHWIMLAQLIGLLIVAFIFVRNRLGVFPACLGVIWLLHSRHMIQRISLGLPRGWPPLLIVGGVYYMAKRNPYGVAFTMLAAVLLNAPAALIIGASYGFLLVLDLVYSNTRQNGLLQLKRFVPLALAIVLMMFVVHSRPEWIGKAVTIEQAQHMPEMRKPLGRFPLVPLSSAVDEIKLYGFMAFTSILSKSHPEIKKRIPFVVGALLLVACAISLWRFRTIPIPREVLSLGAGSLLTYFAARILAFKLFIPDRYLLVPLVIFFVFAGLFIIANLFRSRAGRAFGYALLATLVWCGSGSGLQGDLNFNKNIGLRSYAVWRWMAENLSKEAVLIGHPNSLDMAMLVGQRRAYINTEAAHPIFSGYNDFIKPRLERSFRALYAKDLLELFQVLEGSEVTHVLFKRDLFYPEKLAKAKYFPPYNRLVTELTARPIDQFAFRELQNLSADDQARLIVYQDSLFYLVSVAGLKELLVSRGQLSSGKIS